jgi:hypothetical protein
MPDASFQFTSMQTVMEVPYLANAADKHFLGVVGTEIPARKDGEWSDAEPGFRSGVL